MCRKLDWQTLFALVANNVEQVVPIEVANDRCYVYQTQKKGFPFKQLVRSQRVTFCVNELDEIVAFLDTHNYTPAVKEIISSR